MSLNMSLCRSLTALLLLLFAVGCGGGLTGKVTVNGVEVNVGTLKFNPDLDAGVDGPMVFANVRDGVYHLHRGSKTTLGKNSVSLTVATKWLDSNGQDTNLEGDVATTDLVQSIDISSASSFDLSFDTNSPGVRRSD